VDDAALDVRGGEECGRCVAFDPDRGDARIDDRPQVAAEATGQVGDREPEGDKAARAALSDERVRHHLEPFRAVEKGAVVAKSFSSLRAQGDLLGER
jgi:hypothetical protein